jgi:hypothetical protein
MTEQDEATIRRIVQQEGWLWLAYVRRALFVAVGEESYQFHLNESRICQNAKSGVTKQSIEIARRWNGALATRGFSMISEDEATIRRIVREASVKIVIILFVSMVMLTLSVLIAVRMAHAGPTPTPTRKPWLAGHPLPVIPMRTLPCPSPVMTTCHNRRGQPYPCCQRGTLERSGGCSCVPTTDMRKP